MKKLIFSRWRMKVLSILLMLLIPISILAKDNSVGNTLVGAWKTEPILSQLGLIQTSYIFKANGSYSRKNHFISFCEEHLNQKCEYFWMIDEGKYSIDNNGVLTLDTNTDITVLLKKGKNESESRKQSSTHYSKRYKIELDQEKLIILGKDGKSKPSVFNRFVPTLEDGKSPSKEQIRKYYRDAMMQDKNTF